MLKFLGKIIELLDTSMTTPTTFGWFHILCVVLLIAACVALCHFKKNADEGFVRRLLLISALVVIVLEIYKQINFTFSFDGTKIIADYQWYIFPFQFCSTPMYIFLLAALVPKGKLHDAFCAFLATFAVFAGLCVMVYPEQVFISTIGINLQSMICHGAMVLVGFYLLASGYVRIEHKTILKAIPVFSVCIVLAIIMNEIAYFTGLLKTESFNMFYISPHCEPSLPVYALVQEVVPFPWCVFIYIFAFSLAAYVILLVAMGVKGLRKKLK